MIFLIDWLSFGEGVLFEIGRQRSREWENFGCRWTSGVRDLKHWRIFMNVICVSSLMLSYLLSHF